MNKQHFTLADGTTGIIEQLDDCEIGLWYLTECSVAEVVGICAATDYQLMDSVRAGVVEMKELSDG